MRSVRFCTLLFAAGALLLAQHGYTPGDVEEGEQLFIENCAICHGPEGDAVPRVNLASGKFRHGSSDEELTQTIKNGIPGTAMPPGNFHEHQLTALIAYVRSMNASSAAATVTLGNAARGQTIFEGAGGCTQCHRVNGKGSYLGPELSDVGVTRRAAQLERSILEPDAEILPQNRFFSVTTRDGATITGRLLNLDTFSVQLMDTNERLRSFSKTNLKEYGFVDKSPMPSYKDKLSSEQLADLVGYLVTLRGGNKQ
ncbi:MAG: c-type cytochrome [Bryobacteraceae bacterium]|jgi:putative heme-binding domain-containing protein